MAYFTLNKKIILKKYSQVCELADRVSYSSKTNQIVTKILEKETDSFFSVHFVNELKHVKDMKRIYFLTQAVDEKQLKELIKKGIDKFVVDNETDLNILLDYIKKYNVSIELFLRVKLKERSIKTERYFVFGMLTEVVNKRIKELKDNKNISALGIHFHRKTQNVSEWNLTYEIQEMFTKETLQTIDYLNVGGGLPSKYANSNVDVFESIIKKITELKQFLNEINIKLIIEPGRFIAAPSGKLHTKILAIYEDNIIVDASVYNSDLDALVVPVKLLVEGELNKVKGKVKGKPYVIKGATPCSMDLFRYRVYLDNPQVGDDLVFINAGAYNFSTDFCDLEPLQTIIE